MDTRPTRWVDKIPSRTPRPKEMEVLCLGLSRTGTMSLYTALNKLGYKSYHYMELRYNIKDHHWQCWGEAINTKMYGNGIPYGRLELDKLLGDYSAVTDAPCVNMADALLKAYPNAKVVLNVRDIDPWLASMETSYYRILAWKPLQVLASIKYSNLAQHTDLLRLILADWTGGDWQNRRKLREEFVKHYAHIRAIVPKDNLLEHRPQDGWGPLCKFLGKPVPDEPYPRVNEGDSVFNIHVTVFWIVAGQLVVKFVAPVLVVAFAFWYYRK